MKGKAMTSIPEPTIGEAFVDREGDKWELVAEATNHRGRSLLFSVRHVCDIFECGERSLECALLESEEWPDVVEAWRLRKMPALCPKCLKPITDEPPDEKPREDVIPEHHDCMAPARGARWTLPEPVERKPVAGWEVTHTGRWLLKVGPLVARVTAQRTWHVEVVSGATGIIFANCDDRADSLEAAQLAAEDALFAIADAINALRGRP